MQNETTPVIIVGGKPGKGLANYQAAVIRKFAEGASKVLLRARGKACSLAELTALTLGQLSGYACDEHAKIGLETGRKQTPVQFCEIHVYRTQN